jgi:hypothetical protein
MPTYAEIAERPSGWAVDYWLAHCDGYRVFTPEGPIGYVEEVLESPEEEPTALVVRVGDAFSHCIQIPVGDIVGFNPAGERVLVGPLETPESAGEDPAPVRQLRIPAAV